jgi:hypothetical protein
LAAAAGTANSAFVLVDEPSLTAISSEPVCLKVAMASHIVCGQLLEGADPVAMKSDDFAKSSGVVTKGLLEKRFDPKTEHEAAKGPDAGCAHRLCPRRAGGRRCSGCIQPRRQSFLSHPSPEKRIEWLPQA